MDGLKDEHIDWIDTAKSIGVIFVILGHLVFHNESMVPIAKAIYSFHMPMFFILSGYVNKPYGCSFYRYAKVKFFRLIVPILIISAFLQVLYILVNGLDNIRSFISGYLFIEGYIYFNYPAWFFFVLFEALLVIKAVKIDQK